MSPSGLAVAGIGLLSLIGAAAVLVGGFLDWWNVAGVSVTAWDLPMKFLLTGDVGDSIKAGPFLFVVVLVALPLLTRRPVPGGAAAIAGVVPFLIAATALIRGVREDPSIDPRIGLLLTLAGGVLVMLDASSAHGVDEHAFGLTGRSSAAPAAGGRRPRRSTRSSRGSWPSRPAARGPVPRGRGRADRFRLRLPPRPRT